MEAGNRPFSTSRTPGSCSLVIFGASGDLTRRKLLPALWNLHMERALPEGFSVVGVARTPRTHEEFRAEARRAAETHSRFRRPDAEEWHRFSSRLFYQPGRYDDPENYATLRRLLEELCNSLGSCGNRLYYLATPPGVYEEIARQLGRAGLTDEAALENGDSDDAGWARIIVEKPFGYDLASARRLGATLRQNFHERQIYRIDHYLGKETVQNLLVFRFANGIFEPIWNRRYVDHVQLCVAEELGVEGRGDYYDDAGALRDMVQNHLLQVLCLVAMEPPARIHHREVRNEKAKVLEAIRPIAPAETPLFTARGQYTAGTVGGRAVPGYLDEPRVRPGSRTETYAAVKFLVENWRWAGVPFYVRTGKRLPQRVTEVTIHYRTPPLLLFPEIAGEAREANILSIRVQPNEGIALRFGVKVPGSGMRVRPVTMDFDYCREFHAEPPEAYERLLLDCMLGDITLFSRDDWMDLSWQLVDPILQGWAQDTNPIPLYAAGTWGPREADALLERDGRTWRQPG